LSIIIYQSSIINLSSKKSISDKNVEPITSALHGTGLANLPLANLPFANVPLLELFPLHRVQ